MLFKSKTIVFLIFN